MDAKLKADWVKALRSGKYKQYNAGGIGGHKRGSNNLCCLGVGGRVAGVKAGFIHGILTADCITALGLSEHQGQILYEMNDKEKKTFPEIADYIETDL